eukprot:CAMPEP_0172506768 /NCGR_PEP_ID=MMETSP1066-20121228/198123_1 /TAXON_ID=671091 /ORGANISM="Coscinodiscus wailesii, Strain CCMP2513" /LENGTH=189 /DNA_ID=CAMNT_0013283957 /DNA_START=48 /DNA_END=614 /DNA_ORIENTATION=-
MPGHQNGDGDINSNVGAHGVQSYTNSEISDSVILNSDTPDGARMTATPSKNTVPLGDTDEEEGGVNETTGLLSTPKEKNIISGSSSQQEHKKKSSDCERPKKKAISAFDYYFGNGQKASATKYYRFTSTPMTPFAALYKRHDTIENPSESPNRNADVTGLLRRSAVLPSHGTDPTGRWILVSVGGRSGW